MSTENRRRALKVCKAYEGSGLAPLYAECEFCGHPKRDPYPHALHRSEHVLRAAVIDVLCMQPPEPYGSRLRRALNESREPEEHPEDRCEECREPFDPWAATPEDWERATGRNWGGPILCYPCFRVRLTGAGATTNRPCHHGTPRALWDSFRCARCVSEFHADVARMAR